MAARRRESFVIFLQVLPMFYGWWRRSRRENIPFAEVLRREREELDAELTDEERELVRRVGDERRARNAAERR